MKKKVKIQLISEFISDFVALVVSCGLSYLIFGIFIVRILDYSGADWMEYCFLLFISFVAVFAGFSTSINLEKRSKTMEILSVLRSCSLTYMIFAVLLLLFKNPIIDSRYLFLSSFVLYAAILAVNRYFFKRILTNNYSESKNATLVGIITTSERAEEFTQLLKNDWSKKIKGLAIVDSVRNEKTGCFEKHKSRVNFATDKGNPQILEKNDEYTSICDIPVVANLDNFLDWARISSIDEVFINVPTTSGYFLDEFIEELEEMGITVHINIPTLERIVEESKFNNIHCDVVGKYPMATFSAAVHNQRGLSAKRIFDVIGSFFGMIISLPIIAIVAIPLLIESPGPLIFKQQRIGKNGRVFNMYKLRSMYVDAEERKKELLNSNTMNGFMFKMDNDPRITKVGKFIRKTSIDELPQFFNVLKGDMSLVGTRPPTIDEFEKYQNHHKRRLSMRPGITGMWQVSGRSNIQDFEDVVKLDCEYIDNWSFSSDIKILLKTIPAVFCHKGAK